MKRRIINFIGTSFMVLSLVIFAFLIADFSQQLTNGCEKNVVYAMGRKHRHPGHGTNPVPEPSTLVLLGTGLAVGGGIYSIIKYRKRNKK